MKICFLYGGQGSQKTGMGKDLYENYPVFKEFYDSLSTNFDLKDYSFNQSDEEISKTQYTQPLMVAFQIGITKILKDKGIVPDIVGGLSIGEYSALYTSGVITDKDAILIAEKRGVAMSKSSDVSCKMMAIVGAPVDLVRDVCEKVSEKTGYDVQISNLNCPGQIVIAGEANAIDEVVSILKENKIRNFGMPNPSGYRKALRLMKHANDFNMPIICFVDTPGAFCGIEAEEKGQAEAIARALFEMSDMRVPVLSVVIGEGGSGGALALAVANEVWMLEHSIYSILSPEGFASILYKDAKKNKEAAEVMKITAKELKELGVIDRVIKENLPLTVDTMDSVVDELSSNIDDFFEKTAVKSGEEIAKDRYNRFRKF